MFQDERILERKQEMSELQKVFVEGQDPWIDQMAVKYCIELLQEALRNCRRSLVPCVTLL